MSRRFSPAVLAVAFAAFLPVGSLSQTITDTWVGARADGYAWHGGNWQSGLEPLEDLQATSLLFGPAGNQQVYYYEFWAQHLSLVGHHRPYWLLGGYDTLNLGSGGLRYAPAAPLTSYLDDRVRLHGAQTWNIESGTLVVRGEILDTSTVWNGIAYDTVRHDGVLIKTGAGTLFLEEDGNEDWFGDEAGRGVVLQAGRLAVTGPGYTELAMDFATSEALGRGSLTFDGGTLVARANRAQGDRRGLVPFQLWNDVVSTGLISTENDTTLRLGYQSEGNSSVLLEADTTIASRGRPLHLLGDFEELAPRKVTIESEGAVVLEGAPGWSGGTQVNKGVLVFANGTPTTGQITIGADGYAGVSNPLDAGPFLTKVDPASTGTIGFDTEPGSEPNMFTAPIDVSGFTGNVRIGSATSAVLAYNGETGAIITPKDNVYRFGGGGGYLEVQSPLVDDGAARSLVVDSPAQLPLLVRLDNAFNDFSGGTSITNSGVVFGSDASPGGAGKITVNQGGYVGFESWGDQSTQQMVDGSLAQINQASTGMVGFDDFTNLDAAVNLSGFANPLYLGTASSLELTGQITPKGNIYRFAAYKGGELTVSSALADNGTNFSVHIGDPNSFGTHADLGTLAYSSVYLRGPNTYTGTTTLYTGELRVGQTNGAIGENPTTALGTGALIVQPHNLTLPYGYAEFRPQLVADDGVIIPNELVLNTTLNLGGEDSYYTLSGPISGSGRLWLNGDYQEIRLTGNNTFSGGIYVGAYSAAVRLGSDTAAGTGPIGFGLSSGGYAYFETAAPVVNGIYTRDDADYASLYFEANDTVLTLNPATDAVFRGSLYNTSASNAMRLVKGGAGTLTLEDGSYGYRYVEAQYTPTLGTPEASLPDSPNVGLQINQGTLVLRNYELVNSSNTVWVNGGTLALEEHTDIYNPVVVTSGRIAGSGFISNLRIGANAVLSPGLASTNPIGELEFGDLTLGSGGLYEWNLIAADPEMGGFDQTYVYNLSTLHVAAAVDDPETPGDERFTLKLISLKPDGSPGTVTGFSGDRSYTYTLFDATHSSIDWGTVGNVVDLNKFIIDASQFFTDLPIHTLTLSTDGDLIQLTFQPVPEPSTYALMGIGLTVVLVSGRRKFLAQRKKVSGSASNA